MNNQGLKSKTVSAVSWSILEFFSKQGIQLVIQILLARLLLPEYFGLIGMVTIFVAISNSMVNSGLDQALIREKNPKEIDFSTVFYYNLVISVAAYTFIFLTSPLVSQFYGEPKLTLILRVLMISVVFNALSTIQRVQLVRKINFKIQTKVTVISTVVSGVLAILLAVKGLGVWSLVIQNVIMYLTQMLLLIYYIRWIPNTGFSMVAFKKYFGFGNRLLISGFIDVFYKNIYYVIIGRLYPANYLGYYTNARKLKDISTNSFTLAIQKVTYPVLSRMQDDKKRLDSSYRKLIGLSAYLIFPFMMGIAATAPTFIPLLLGENWIQSITYLQLLSLAGILYPIHALNLNVLKVKGRSDLFLRLEIIKKGISTVTLFVAVLVTTNVEGLIMATVINSYISLFVNMYYSVKEIEYSIKQQILDLLPIVGLTALMYGSVVIVQQLLSGNGYTSLLIQILTGILVYVGFSIITKHKHFNMMVDIIKDILESIRRKK